MKKKMSDKVDKENLKKILVIKMRYIGDTVLVTPLMTSIKKSIPHARLDIVVNKGTESVLLNHPHVDRIFAFDYIYGKKRVGYSIKFALGIRKQHYDLVIDLTNNDRSALFTFISGAANRIGYISEHKFRQKLAYNRIVDSILGTLHTVDHYLKTAEALGVLVADIHPSVYVSKNQMIQAKKKLVRYGLNLDKPFAIIHPGARRWYKSWPLSQFAGIADVIIKRYGVQVVLAGHSSDESACLGIVGQMRCQAQVFNISGRITLSELPALIKKSSCLIGNDSSPIHIATAVQTPVIALFGPTEWEYWSPRRAHDRVIAAEYPCRPCGHARKDCPRGDDYCMQSISFERVLNAVDEVFRINF